jgi:hypothetical protein
MKGGRTNIGRTNVAMGGKRATRLGPGADRVFGGSGEGQSTVLAPQVPLPQATRHRPASPSVPRTGTREVPG